MNKWTTPRKPFESWLQLFVLQSSHFFAANHVKGLLSGPSQTRHRGWHHRKTHLPADFTGCICRTKGWLHYLNSSLLGHSQPHLQSRTTSFLPTTGSEPTICSSLLPAMKWSCPKICRDVRIPPPLDLKVIHHVNAYFANSHSHASFYFI